MGSQHYSSAEHNPGWQLRPSQARLKTRAGWMIITFAAIVVSGVIGVARQPSSDPKIKQRHHIWFSKHALRTRSSGLTEGHSPLCFFECRSIRVPHKILTTRRGCSAQYFSAINNQSLKRNQLVEDAPGSKPRRVEPEKEFFVSEALFVRECRFASSSNLCLQNIN